jgi:hypothetical protein
MLGETENALGALIAAAGESTLQFVCPFWLTESSRGDDLVVMIPRTTIDGLRCFRFLILCGRIVVGFDVD